LFNLNILKKVKIKSNSIDFNKYVSLFKMKLETERKSVCNFMNLHYLQRETECGGPIDSTRASFYLGRLLPQSVMTEGFVSTLLSFMSFHFIDH
jgi:hypothetical protein